MKKILIGLLSAILLLSAVPASAAGVCNSWARDGIDKANLCGLIPWWQYLGDYTDSITRGNIAELIIRAYNNISGKPYIPGEAPFEDTSSDYATAVYELGIMNGTGDGVFSPYAYTTRQEIAKIMLSFKAVIEGEQLALPQEYECSFSDFDEISDWAKPYVALASSEKIINGYDDGSFDGKGIVSWEQAISLITRVAELNEKAMPQITSPAWDEIIPSDKKINVGVDAASGYTVYAAKAGEYQYSRPVGDALEELDENSMYYIFAECDGVFSEPVRIYTDKYSLVPEFEVNEAAGTVRIRWNRLPDTQIYTVKITENRCSYYEGEIPPADTAVYELKWEDYLDIDVNPNRKYLVEIISGDYYCTDEFYTMPAENEGADEILMNYPTTKEEADALMETVTVPVWRLSGGKKISSTASITVHRVIAEKIKLVFEEIYHGTEKFPVKDVGGYSWRGGSSEHNIGTAVDINFNENYCIYTNGTTVGEYWKPYEDPYSITPYGDVVKAFEKYGFTWGGDAWPTQKDYMHFSYLGT